MRNLNKPDLRQCPTCKRILRIRDGKIPPHAKQGTTLIKSLLDGGFRNICRGSNERVYDTQPSF